MMPVWLTNPLEVGRAADGRDVDAAAERAEVVAEPAAQQSRGNRGGFDHVGNFSHVVSDGVTIGLRGQDGELAYVDSSSADARALAESEGRSDIVTWRVPMSALVQTALWAAGSVAAAFVARALGNRVAYKLSAKRRRRGGAR
jgi:hypothetical protein